MKPEQASVKLLSVARSKAKMYEYDVPQEDHIKIPRDPADLFYLAIGLLGDFAASINRGDTNASELQTNLRFSAYFFDSYFQSKLNETFDPYLILLGAASYYLCDRPGSAAVLTTHDTLKKEIDLNCEGLEHLLLWILRGNQSLESWHDVDGRFAAIINTIPPLLTNFFAEGVDDKKIIAQCKKLRETVYEIGTPRQLLFGDIIGAVLRKKLENSCWQALPYYSTLPKHEWKATLQKKGFVAELWPAQHLLGKERVFEGESTVIQMPTSAGKTKATELIIRSAFLAERASLVVVVAPFRALCHEIKNSFESAFRGEDVLVQEISDVPQNDFFELLGLESTKRQIVVITPEKLLYVLRHQDGLAQRIGLAIFDEGHQFDSGTRGVTYELLLTSLRSMLPANAQKILISAVISNAEVIGTWFNGNPHVVSGANLSPTYRSMGFASWKDQRGRIEYVNERNADQNLFFVPRVIEQVTLARKGRERAARLFPVKKYNKKKRADVVDSRSIALYLGLKLASKGSVAIFCGKKDSASSICETVVDVFSRNLPMTSPKEYSDSDELENIYQLIVQNLGGASPSAQSARYGIFSHHGNVPHGVRLAVEHAMREGLIKFVVCTSTLAQGVNLPIRYLIVNSVRQGNEQIKTRDFHNLMGRTGRAGMYTEGSVLFADSNVYDTKNTRNENWRWKNVKNLIDIKNSEPCASSLLRIFDPIISDDNEQQLDTISFVDGYLHSPNVVGIFIDDYLRQILKQHGVSFTGDDTEKKLRDKIALVNSIESFLLYHWDEKDNQNAIDNAVLLAEQTLAFSLADESKRQLLKELFKLIAENIREKVPEPARRRVFGKTLFGIKDSQKIEQWTIDNLTRLKEAGDDTRKIVEVLWEIMPDYISHNVFKKITPSEFVKEIFIRWIQGDNFASINSFVQERGIRLVRGKGTQEIDIDNIVDLCENGFSFEGNLVVACVNEFIELCDALEGKEAKSKLELFQKQMKYGLPSASAIGLFELGFADRVVAMDIAKERTLAKNSPKLIVQFLVDNEEATERLLAKYPIYFQLRFDEIRQNERRLRR